MAGFFSRWFGNRRWNSFEDRGGGEMGGGPAGPSTASASGGAGAAAAAAAPAFEFAPLPKLRIAGIKSLFTWNAWMGISIIEYLFVLAYCLLGVFMVMGIFQAVTSGSAGYALLYIVLAPIWLLILTMALRLLSELCISVLMAPHLLNQHHKELVRVLQEQQLQLQQAAGQASFPPEMESELLEGGGLRGVGGPGSGGNSSRPGSGSFRGIGSGEYGGGNGGGRRGGITAGDLDEEEIGIRMASV